MEAEGSNPAASTSPDTGLAARRDAKCSVDVSSVARDDDGRVRVLASPLTFPDVVESAFAEIARYGWSSVSVTCRVLEAVRNISACVRCEADRSALLREATVVAAGVCDVSLSDYDRRLIAQCHRAALDVLHAPQADQLAAS